MMAPASGSPNAESEGIVAPASSFEDGQRMCRGSQSGIQLAPATRLAATRLAVESEAAFPMWGGGTPVLCGVFTTFVDSAYPHALALIPASPQMDPGETPASITVTQMLRNSIRRLVHAVTSKTSVANSFYGCARLSVAWPPSRALAQGMDS